MSVAPLGSSSSGPGWRTPAVIVACGCLIAVLTFGVRASFGLFTAPISLTQGWVREVFALAIAIQNLLWGVGQPFAGALADRFGSARVLAAGGFLYAVGVALMAVASTPLMASTPGPSISAGEVDFGLKRTLALAFGHRSYLLLTAGFFVCGFHLAFVTVHLPPYLTDHGIAPQLAAWSIAIIGLGNIAGSYAAGVISGRHSKRWLLAAIYALRSVAMALFILLPISPLTVVLFAVSIGLLWLSTIPPTSGLVVLMFGTRYMATLFGIVFFSHQVGSFLGIWLGGLFYEAYGSYDAVWWMAVALGVFAALIHVPIVERPAPSFAIAAA